MKRAIFINGTYGVGKSTLANTISELLNGQVECVDPDLYYNNLVKKDMAFLFFGWPIQKNEMFLRGFREIILDKLQDKEIIIPIAITTEICKKELLDYISKKTEIIHMVLEANEESLFQRIKSDVNRNKDFSIENIKNNNVYIKKNFEKVVHINTTNESIVKIANLIIEEYL